MKSLLLLTAAALAATLFVAAPAGAADLGYGPVYEDDNVYAEVTHRKKKNYYYNSYSDNQYDQNDPNKDVYDPAYDAAAGNDEVVDAECVSKRTIRVRLKEQGWKTFPWAGDECRHHRHYREPTERPRLPIETRPLLRRHHGVVPARSAGPPHRQPEVSQLRLLTTIRILASTPLMPRSGVIHFDQHL